MEFDREGRKISNEHDISRFTMCFVCNIIPRKKRELFVERALVFLCLNMYLWSVCLLEEISMTFLVYFN